MSDSDLQTTWLALLQNAWPEPGDSGAELRRLRLAFEQLTEAMAQLAADNHALTVQLREAGERQQQRQAERAMLLEWLDLYDRLSAGHVALQKYRPSKAWLRRSRPRDVLFINSLVQGQDLTLNRVQHALQRHQVEAIDCLGQPFDPHTMTAVAVGLDPQSGNGIVLEELRKGFLVDGQVLRLAEVRVNKL